MIKSDRHIEKTFAFIAATLLASSANAQGATAQNPSWTEPVTPFRIADRLYYVGSRELTAFIVNTGKGLILLDTGVPEFAPKVLANIRALGFDPKDVKILLNSQAHFDHAGGLAAIKAATGAKMLASADDAPLLERGGKGDFAWGDDLPYPPVKVDRIVRDGEQVKLGKITMTAHLTPGHTKGCTSWTMPVEENGRTYTANFNCSVGVPGYKLLGTPAYPNMAEDYARTFAKLRHLPCDIFLGSHGSFFNLDEKRTKLGAKTNPFVDPQGCRDYLKNAEARFRDQLERERAALRR